jgi:crossover junction endodeoxyribonuclease RuvC
MIVMAFDPGTATTGYGVIEEVAGGKLVSIAHGVVSTSAGVEPPLRLQKIYNETAQLLDKYQPDTVATERLFFNNNVTTALSVGRTIGVILLAVAERNLPWQEYTPPQVKKAVTGVGSADKQQVQWMVKRLLCLKDDPKPDDAADALAIAICHCHSAKLLLRGITIRK